MTMNAYMMTLKAKMTLLMTQHGYPVDKLTVKGEVLNVYLVKESDQIKAMKLLPEIRTMISADGAGHTSDFDANLDKFTTNDYNNTQGVQARVQFQCVNYGV